MQLQITMLMLYSIIGNVELHQWFYISNMRPELDNATIVIDVDNEIPKYPGARLYACPAVEGRASQLWRWQGRMLINKANQLAIDFHDSLPKVGQPLVVSKPNNSANQRWRKEDKYLINDINNYVMELDTDGMAIIKYKTLRGQPLVMANKTNAENQMFQLLLI